MVEVLHMVAELVHKLEKGQHMVDQLEPLQAEHKAQDMDDLLVLVLVEDKEHHMVEARLQVELYVELAHQQVDKYFEDMVVAQERGKGKAAEQAHRMDTSLAEDTLALNMEIQHRTS
jgi:hypothetical protein